LGDTTVVSVFGSLFRAAKRVAAAWCWRHSVQKGASGCAFVSRKQRKGCSVLSIKQRSGPVVGAGEEEAVGDEE
ncbi:hypothetical protein GW17_00055204, partial [Ensete ventricosum]